MAKKKINVVNATLLFVLAVSIVLVTFSMTNSSASGSEEKVIYGIVSYTDGQYAQVKQISEAMDIDLKIKDSSKLMPLDIITIVVSNDEVVNWSFSTEKEINQLCKKYYYTLMEYREGIIETAYFE